MTNCDTIKFYPNLFNDDPITENCRQPVFLVIDENTNVCKECAIRLRKEGLLPPELSIVIEVLDD